MISVLYQQPPPGTSIQRRRGYSSLDADETTRPAVDIPSAEVEGTDPEFSEEQEAYEERKVIQQEGWLDLVVSFAASGAMTVGVPANLS